MFYSIGLRQMRGLPSADHLALTAAMRIGTWGRLRVIDRLHRALLMPFGRRHHGHGSVTSCRARFNVNAVTGVS
jgi:hypothetical protein